MSITVNEKELEYREGCRAIDFAKGRKIISCKINNKLRDLSYQINDGDIIELLGIQDSDSVKVYEASLRYVLAMAIDETYPHLKVNCDYYISRSICFKKNYGEFSEEEFDAIKEKMKEIVEKDYPFIRKTISLKEANEYYENNGFEDKVEVYKYRKSDDVHIYECHKYINYAYSYMVPSTGYLNNYNLTYYKGKIILQCPRFENNGEVVDFKSEDTYERTLEEAYNWGKEIGSLTVAQINENVLKDKTGFIQKCEKRHADAIQDLANKIIAKGDVKLIAIAGPSSSGKTTFACKLRKALEEKGIHPVKISMDDYYLDRNRWTEEERQNIDYEDINLLDIELFNQHLKELSEGKEVEMPRFDFVTQSRALETHKLKLMPNEPIIIEGIHALNKIMTASIPKENKFTIYIGPHIQVNIDDLNPISITHLRLIRRMVRDYRTRGSELSRTLPMWDSVRRGEFKWIYDNQEGVDYVYNSVLDYEFCVMKKYAIPLLKEVTAEESYYNLSKTLVKYLKYFVDIDDEDVPEDSLLREFIGGSIFKEV